MAATIPVSSVPAVRAYLVAAITTQVQASHYTEPGVEVYSVAVDHDTTQDVVVVGKARRKTEPGSLVGGGGAHFQFERYRLEVVIECDAWGPNDTPTVVENRAYALLANVETAVRADPSLGGLVVEAYPDESEDDPSWSAEHKGARCQLVAQIHVLNEL